MALKGMLERLGQPKTHLAVVEMIKEVDTSDSGSISYKDDIIAKYIFQAY